MMGGPARRIVHIRKSTKRHIVERQSTAAISPAARLLQRGLAYIKKNVTSGITTENVVKHLGVSRRLADLRFNEFDGRSVHEVIVDTRLEELKRLLADSDIPIARVTAACGFGSENYAKNLFRRRFGMSMSEFRSTSSSRQDDT